MQLTDLKFEQQLRQRLPVDPSDDNRPRQVAGALISPVQPQPVSAPTLVAWSQPCADLLGLAQPADPAAAARVLSGNRLLAGMAPYASCYGGHQFGNWAGQLGDGRAMTLGEVVGPQGTRWELQLKGAGLTPYSRGADGRAVLRSSLREFLCSEAMAALGVPTTRALSLVTTGDAVVRDMFYDGRPEAEPGAVVCRVSPSFLRFGHLELPARRDDRQLLAQLGDHVLASLYPELDGARPQAYADLFREICRRTALMVAHWMRVGFVHGVMNTDNMSLLGETIDYGPYGWLEPFEPDWTPNTTDLPGRRYCYGNQPSIALWNLKCLALALQPLGLSTEQAEAGLRGYHDDYEHYFGAMLTDKLGLQGLAGQDDLVDDLLRLLQQVETDMTLFFRGLIDLPLASAASDAALLQPIWPAFYLDDGAPLSSAQVPRADWLSWLQRYRQAVAEQGVDPDARRQRMTAANPRYVPRNYLAQIAIDAAAAGDTQPLETFMKVLQHPYDDQPEHAAWAEKRPEWARQRAGCSMLSCSS